MASEPANLGTVRLTGPHGLLKANGQDGDRNGSGPEHLGYDKHEPVIVKERQWRIPDRVIEAITVNRAWPVDHRPLTAV